MRFWIKYTCAVDRRKPLWMKPILHFDCGYKFKIADMVTRLLVCHPNHKDQSAAGHNQISTRFHLHAKCTNHFTIHVRNENGCMASPTKGEPLSYAHPRNSERMGFHTVLFQRRRKNAPQKHLCAPLRCQVPPTHSWFIHHPAHLGVRIYYAAVLLTQKHICKFFPKM